MKKLIILFLVLVPFLYSCDKESEGVSDTVYYVKIEMKAGSLLVVKKGANFVDPGFVATENGVDVNAKVKVEGSVDPTKVGGYYLNYSAVNKDGYESTASRLVLVIPEDIAVSSEDITGIYHGQMAGKPFVNEASAITQIQEGLFEAEDLFGGYYNITKKYGGAYRLKTYFILKSDNTLESIYNESGFGSFAVLNSKYDPKSGVLTYILDDQQGFSIGVTLTKK